MFRKEGSLGKNKRKGGDIRMVKRILLVLVIGSFMVGTAFAQTYTETYHSAMAKFEAKDYAGAKVGFAKALAIEGITPKNMSTVQFFIGWCDYEEKHYPEARAEFAKVKGPGYTVAAEFYTGRCYSKEGNKAEAQQMFIRICETKRFDIEHIKLAFKAIDRAMLGKKGYCHLLIGMIINLNKERLSNVEFISTLISAFDGEIGLKIIPDQFDREGNPIKNVSVEGLEDRFAEVFSEEYK